MLLVKGTAQQQDAEDGGRGECLRWGCFPLLILSVRTIGKPPVARVRINIDIETYVFCKILRQHANEADALINPYIRC